MLKVIVPFRCTDQPERIFQLQLFIHTMQAFFPSVQIFIMDQSGTGPFNRGFLLNAGAKISGAEEDDIICFHNLNKLPSIDCLHCYVNPLPRNTVRHLRDTGSHSKLGNIIFVRYSDFLKINGYPNDLYGCTGADSELHMRILKGGLRIERKEGTLLNMSQIQPPSPTNQQVFTQWDKLDWHRQHPNHQGLAQLCDNICTLTCSDPNVKRYAVNIVYRIPPANDID